MPIEHKGMVCNYLNHLISSFGIIQWMFLCVPFVGLVFGT